MNNGEQREPHPGEIPAQVASPEQAMGPVHSISGQFYGMPAREATHGAVPGRPYAPPQFTGGHAYTDAGAAVAPPYAPPYAPTGEYITAQPNPAAASSVASAPRRRLPLNTADLVTAVRVPAFALASVLAVLTALVAVVSLTTFPDGHGGGLADWLRTGITLVVMAVGGRLAIEGGLDSTDAHATFSAGLRAIPLVITFVLLLLTARATAKAERKAPSTTPTQLLLRSVLTGLVAGVGLTVLAAVSSTSSPFGADVNDGFLSSGRTSLSLGPGVVGSFVGGALLVAAVVAVGRLRVSGMMAPLWARADLVPLRAVLGVLKTFAAGLLALAAAVCLVWSVYRLGFSDASSDSRVPAIVALVLLCANTVLGLVLFGLGLPLDVESHKAVAGDLLGLFDPSLHHSSNATFNLLLANKWFLLVFLVPLLIALGTAVRRTLRRPPFRVDGTALKWAAGAGAVLGLVAAWVLQVSMSSTALGTGDDVVSGEFDVSMAVGFSLLWAPLLGAVWGLLAVAAMRLGPTLALSLPRPVSRLLGSRRIAPEWAMALNGSGPAPAGHRSPFLRVAALATAGLLVLAGVGTAAVAVIGAYVITPQAAVQDYLAAVTTRDVPSALGHLADPPDQAKQPLLSSAVLHSADYSGISHVTIGRVTQVGSTATVEASYAVDGRTVADAFDLVQAQGILGLGHWKIQGDGSHIGVGSDSRLPVTIGGHEVAGGNLAALPGSYIFHVAGNDYLQPAQQKAVVKSSDNGQVNVHSELLPRVQSAIESAVKSRAEACARKTTLPLSADCPFLQELSQSSASYWYSSRTDEHVHNASITITEMPTLQYTYNAESGRVLFSSGSSGQVEVTGTDTYTDFLGDDESEPYSDSEGFTIMGSAQITGEGVTVLLS